MQLQAVGHIIEDAHGKGGGLLEDHADLAPQFHDVIARVQDIFAIQQDFPGGPLVAVEFINPVVNPDMGGFAAARKGR